MTAPKKIGDVLAKLIVARGYAKTEDADEFDAAWLKAVGPALAKLSKIATIKRGYVDVRASHSAVIQELKFLQRGLVPKLQEALPDHKIRGVRFSLSHLYRSFPDGSKDA